MRPAGYRVIVTDQRGYGDSDKPREVEAYRVDRLGDDVSALLTALGHPAACVAAHDWGAAVAWNLAIRHPERVSRLVILDVPHPDAGHVAGRGTDRLRGQEVFRTS